MRLLVFINLFIYNQIPPQSEENNILHKRTTFFKIALTEVICPRPPHTLPPPPSGQCREHVLTIVISNTE